MTKNRVFGYINDGEIDIISYSEDYNEATVKVLNEAFYPFENVCIGTEINKPESEQARQELTLLCKEVLKDGISLLARVVATNQIVGLAINKLQYLSDEPTFFDEFNKNHVHSKNAKGLMTSMIAVDNLCNLFEKYQANCYMEIMFLATLPTFNKRSIGLMLCKYSIQLADELRQGIGIEVLMERDQHRRPTIVTAIFSSNYSQKIGETLQFEILAIVNFNDLLFDGKTFAQRIGNIHRNQILVAKPLV